MPWRWATRLQWQLMPRLLLCFTLLATGLFPAPPDKPAEKAAEKKSAFDKTTFEAYVRHLNVWGPQIKVEIADPDRKSVV